MVDKTNESHFLDCADELAAGNNGSLDAAHP